MNNNLKNDKKWYSVYKINYPYPHDCLIYLLASSAKQTELINKTCYIFYYIVTFANRFLLSKNIHSGR